MSYCVQTVLVMSYFVLYVLTLRRGFYLLGGFTYSGYENANIRIRLQVHTCYSSPTSLNTSICRILGTIQHKAFTVMMIPIRLQRFCRGNLEMHQRVTAPFHRNTLAEINNMKSCRSRRLLRHVIDACSIHS